MVNKGNIKQDLTSLIDLYKRVVQLKSKLPRLKHRPGQYRQTIIDLKLTENRFKHKNTSLLNKLLASIIEVKYQIGNETYFSRITNISKDEVPYMFEFISSLYNINIKVLEIREIPTFIKSSKL